MNLKKLNDEVLLAKTAALAQEERDALLRLLHHLAEIERRRLFSALKYASLHDYMINELKYTSDDAVRRISSMRLLREIPELSGSIRSGALSMTNMNLAQTLFKKELKEGRRYTSAQKRDVLNLFANQSTRAARKIAADINPKMRQKGLTFDSIEDDVLRDKLLRVKGLLAHTDPYIDLPELLHKMCDMAIDQLTKSPAAPRANSEAEAYREVWRRDQAKCSNCGSQYALEYDHIHPKAAGGATDAKNLRLLCRKCNQRAAIVFYGPKKMHRYFKSVRIEYRSEGKPVTGVSQPLQRQSNARRNNRVHKPPGRPKL